MMNENDFKVVCVCLIPTGIQVYLQYGRYTTKQLCSMPLYCVLNYKQLVKIQSEIFEIMAYV